MTLMRGMFVAAFVVLTGGSVAIHKAVTPLFSGLGGKPEPTFIVPTSPAVPAVVPGRVVAAVQRVAAAPTAIPTSTPTTTPAPSATPITPTSVPTATTVAHKSRLTRRRHTVRRHLHTVRRHPRATPTPLPSPTPTTTSGLVTLDRYWIGSAEAAPGRTISVGYVIDNGTGSTQRIMLGASIKGARVLSWLTGSLADRSHDVVAIVPPGISTHVRYFTVPAWARTGEYDVAWGLRNALTGRRDALVFANGVLHVAR